MNRLPVGIAVVAGGLLCLSVTAQAREFIGFGQEGIPGSLSMQNYPTIQTNSGGTNTVSNFFELSYFSKTGFTGTTRDQFEYWVGANLGYTDPKGNPNSSGFGMSAPEIGLEYYYNLIQPTVPIGAPGYFTFWVSPTIDVNFPNGNTQTTGFGAGADQYSVQVNDDNFIRAGNWDFTFNPVELTYNFGNLNTTPVSGNPISSFHQRGGLSLTVGDIGFGYQFTPDLVVGIQQQFNINNMAGSNISSSREGFIGPAFTYAGFRKIGLYFSGTIQTDYYRENMAHNTYFAAWISKTF